MKNFMVSVANAALTRFFAKNKGKVLLHLVFNEKKSDEFMTGISRK